MVFSKIKKLSIVIEDPNSKIPKMGRNTPFRISTTLDPKILIREFRPDL